MPPTKTDTGHGGLFDLFPERPQAPHGGARFDEGFGLQDKSAPKGRNFDEFGTPKAADSSHGEVWDEWRWKDIPDLHGGPLYDEGFDSPSANQTKQGPLYDLFQPSTKVKYIFDGKDAEGIVDHVVGEDVMVRPRAGGDAVPVGLSQFLAYQSPSIDNATVELPASEAGEPSAHNPTARGGHSEPPPAASTDLGPIIDRVSPGPGNPDTRSAIHADWSTVDHLKSILDGNDVAKTPSPPLEHGDVVTYKHPNRGLTYGKVIGVHASHYGVHNLEHHERHDVPHADVLGQRRTGGRPLAALTTAKTRMPSDSLSSYSEWTGATTVAKDVTVAETAVQGQNNAAPFSGDVGSGSYCPECRASKKSTTDDGRCPDCNTVLKAHDDKVVQREKGDGNGSSEDSSGKGVGKMSTVEDLRKAFGASGDPGTGGQTVTLTGREETTDTDTGKATSDPSGPAVPKREHKDSDHHSNGSGVPTTCPHCGQVYSEEDRLTGQGAPSDDAPGGVTHKCVEGFLDTLKINEDHPGGAAPLAALQALVAA
jgi:hypothetical protein